MSDHIPFELQEQIIKRLPVRSVIRCRSVSKAWKSLIDSSDFIVDHSTQQEYLLVRYKKPNTHRNTYISISFPDQKFVPSLPRDVKRLMDLRVLSSSQGLLCFCGHFDGLLFKAVIWNPSIRKSITISVPKVLSSIRRYETVLGFGVCPVNKEPTLVLVKTVWQKISRTNSKRRIVGAEVYTVSTGRWRSVSSNLLHNSIEVTWSHVAIDRFIYWFAYATVSVPGEAWELRSHYLILSFDMSDESFGEIDLPSSLMESHIDEIKLSKLRESLAILKCYRDGMKQVCDVWVMDHGVQNSFTKMKLFIINASYASTMTPLGFRTNGEPIIQIKGYGKTTLFVYDPASECINDLGISGAYFSCVNSYMETLLLLKH